MVAFIDEKRKSESLVIRGLRLLDFHKLDSLDLKLRIATAGIILDASSSVEPLLSEILDRLMPLENQGVTNWVRELSEFDALVSERDLSESVCLRDRRPAGKEEEADLYVKGEKVGTARFIEKPYPTVTRVELDDDEGGEVGAFLTDLGSLAEPVVVSSEPGGKGERVMLPDGITAAVYAALHQLLQSHA